MGKQIRFRRGLPGALRVLLCLAPVLLAGCAGMVAPPRFVAEDGQTAECARFYARLDNAVAQAGVADAQDARVDGFPYLRINRFLAGAWRPKPDDEAFIPWMRQLRALDTRARWYEIRNLPPERRIAVAAGAPKPREIQRRVQQCAGTLMARDLDDPDTLARLYRSADVRDDYRLIYRVAGLYPLTSVPFYAGVKRLQDAIGRDFQRPLGSLPVSGTLVRYGPDDASFVDSAEVAAILRRAGDNPLRVPLPPADDRARLLRAFAPVFEIDVAGEDDRIGWPYWTGDGLPSADVARPVVFTYLSHVRFESKTLLQLHYVVWFPARPADGPLDILAGRLDGIDWRVTLDDDGRPLLYDSIHNCGCYHLFIPSAKLKLRGRDDGFEEPLLVPQALPGAPGRVVLRIASGTHYIQRAYFDTGGSGDRYALADYDTLRSLAYGARRRSLFDGDGMVPGTERAERWLFWPMGIDNPGAMRQRGRHATAFIGRRHFDDATLVSRYFYRASP